MTAAGKLFGTTGLSEVTVAQILDQSGVKAPTLYHHFGGKEGLYVAWACHEMLTLTAVQCQTSLVFDAMVGLEWAYATIYGTD